ncbi:hypothetical protein PMAYCL1PPCAC_23817, partial [Pristionchus mayeri]
MSDTEMMCVGSGMDEVMWEENKTAVSTAIVRGMNAYCYELRRCSEWFKDNSSKQDIFNFLLTAKDMPPRDLSITSPGERKN